MIFDPMTWLMLAGGALMLVIGGALLRGGPGGRDEVAEKATTAAQDEADARGAEAAKLRATIERVGYEHQAALEAQERHTDEARGELDKAREELAAERTLAREMEKSLNEVRDALHAAEAARKEADQAREEAEKRPPTDTRRPMAPKAPAPDEAAAKARLADVERALAQATSEREAARQKVEALERLVEGVRARSRDLAKELEALKKK